MTHATDLTALSLKDAVAGLKARDFTSREITKAFIGAIEAGNPSLNAFVETTFDHALSQADQSDAPAYKAVRARALEGAPIGVKDLFLHQGCTHDRGIKNIRQFHPAL